MPITVELRPIFLMPHEFIPEKVEEGVLYVSERYKTAIHLCACGCGKSVVTPFSIWGYIKNPDETVTIDGSIGNYNYECKSHYLIKNNKIIWL